MVMLLDIYPHKIKCKLTIVFLGFNILTNTTFLIFVDMASDDWWLKSKVLLVAHIYGIYSDLERR